jgi:sucrose-6-phosphate hydrolase SacC (GH32 family)
MDRITACVAAAAALLAADFARADPGDVYGELYRPGYHLSPQRHWTNEPNGLVQFGGAWHVFYQANPFNSDFGNASWGHATSTDLVHWEQRDVAIPARNGILSFSGTAVFDAANTSGIGTAQNPPLIAAYTGFNIFTGVQDQRLAYSLDGGDTWRKFGGNPVLDIGSNEFRDPKVLWHAPTSRWVMVVTHGGQKRASFWTSPDLIDWTFESNFFGTGMPGSIGGWEVPDFFELPLDGNPGDTRWVLVITPAAGSPAGGNGVFYIYGSFDGEVFTREHPASEVYWLDYGRDYDGVISWENMPAGDDRRIMTGIMNSYGSQIPTSRWRGCFGLPRTVELVTTPDGIRLVQQPIVELQSLRGAPWSLSNATVTPTIDPLDGLGAGGDMLEIVATFTNLSADSFGLDVLEGAGERTRIGYDDQADELFVDRTQSGLILTGAMGGVHTAPYAPAGSQVTLRIFVDRSTLEVFTGDGRVVFNERVFPDPSSVGVSAFAEGGDARLDSIDIYPMSSIWTPEAPEAGDAQIVARWSMDPVPWHTSGRNPVTVDERDASGEGTEVGTTLPFYEGDPASDDLWRFNDLPGQPYTFSSDVPPACMFGEEAGPGTASYDAGAIAAVNGALVCPVDRYGEEFNFTGAFTVEMFFKTDGDRSGAGTMELLRQGENALRYELIVNEGGGGNVTFKLWDALARTASVDIHAAGVRNYADGAWHALVATYDPSVGANGELTIELIDEDGSSRAATATIGAAFGPLPVRNDGNLLIGRRSAFAGAAGRTFLGLIDAVQISSGVLAPEKRLARPVAGRPISRWPMDPAPG